MTRHSVLLALVSLITIPILSGTAPQATPPQSARDRGGPDDTLVVPTGTQIKVDVSEENPPHNVARTYTAKVIAPVQAGGTVAIPALSKVTIRVSIGPPHGEVKELIQVMLDSGSYELQTDRVPVPPGSVSEMVFTLVKDLTLKR